MLKHWQAVCLVLILTGSQTASARERLVLQPEREGLRDVELFLAMPEGDGPFPVMLFVHGHQSAPRPGGRVFMCLDKRPALATVDEGRLRKMQERGYIAAAVSLPGYGKTPGPADFWGPRSHAAAEAALNHLVALPQADRRRVVVYGVSGGAATMSMVATKVDSITHLILVAGLYDLGKAYPTGDDGLDAYIEREAGITRQAFAARAALRYADRITANVLILHGADDTRGGVVDQARMLAQKLREHGTPVRRRIYENTPHSISMAAQWDEIDPWLREATGQ